MKKQCGLRTSSGRHIGTKYTQDILSGRRVKIRKATKSDIRHIRVGEYNPHSKYKYVVKERDGSRWIWDGMMVG